LEKKLRKSEKKCFNAYNKIFGLSFGFETHFPEKMTEKMSSIKLECTMFLFKRYIFLAHPAFEEYLQRAAQTPQP
jgi:hypothetical protein